MYKQINQQPSTREIYLKRLLENGVLDDSRAQAILDKHNTYLEEEFEAGSAYKPNKADWLEGQWSGMTVAYGDDTVSYTHLTLPTKRIV